MSHFAFEPQLPASNLDTRGGVACRAWGLQQIQPEAVDQMRVAAMLPVAVGAALMPDAHVGYGIPIGGVLATDNAVVPYAVGVDIACRVRLSVLDMKPHALERHDDKFVKAIESETRFGVGARFDRWLRRDHPVMDEDWSLSPVTAAQKDRAWEQLGTSGSGNHFVEFGELEVGPSGIELHGERIEQGTYVALLSHSGSRGTGAMVCEHYSSLARTLHPDLPVAMAHLSWLPLDHELGVEYWNAMNLMGRYASANHACIHDALVARLGARVLFGVENHHNFAWKETHVTPTGLREVIVHRKGATPAGRGILGFIPGSMAAPGYLVRGLGEPSSLDSAAHGAGRHMSRSAAQKSLRWGDVQPVLKRARVQLLSAGIDEAPKVYKDIRSVMASQADLVEALAEFRPRIVKMAPAGEKPED
ncbi:MAG: RtcB family protein [Phycisphaerae bacterium]|jgi:tRNA-splicing ligase RtcB|nr:RtcB family protein [Phycisphaerae bacterium]